ncbi:hypothetical protein A7M47_18000, partial [Acinetobacter baumannii]
VRGGHPERDPVELALEVGEHQRHGLGRAGGRRHDVERGGAGAAQVTVAGVEQPLVTGVGVGGGHRPLDDAELLVEDLDEGGEAVGGAGGVADDGLVGVVLVGIDADDVGGDVALAGGGDEHLLGAGLDVLAGALAIDEHARALDDEVDAEVGPRQVGWVAVGHDLDHLAVDGDGVVAHGLAVCVEDAERGVVLEEV